MVGCHRSVLEGVAALFLFGFFSGSGLGEDAAVTLLVLSVVVSSGYGAELSFLYFFRGCGLFAVSVLSMVFGDNGFGGAGSRNKSSLTHTSLPSEDGLHKNTL